ncbi:MAG TPA: SIMPL domain-containing protein [Epulopiscium sp.]|nr:SIMPL domain-containing protein [Candidatus Epulonipiscium sp.]
MKKNYKKLLMISSVLLLTVLSAKTIQASEVQPQKNIIQVSGKATIKVKPNIAYINAMVVTENIDAKKAQEENAKIIDKIKKEIISKYNLKEEDINTVYYGVSPSYDYVEGKQVFRNYGVQHSLEITLNDIQKAGEMVDTLVGNGATSVNNVKLNIKDANEAYNIALQKAIQNAVQKADAITTTLGVKQATPISITEQSESQGVIQERNMIMEDSLTGSSKSATTIQQSDIQVTAIVQVTLQW